MSCLKMNHSVRAVLGLGAVLTLAACDSSPSDPGNGHAEAGRVEIETRGASTVILAEWIDGEGWTDGNGTAISELSDPVVGDDGSRQPLVAGGPPASLTVRFFWPDGTLQEMSTLSRDDVTGERVCSEFEIRYIPVQADEETDVIAWPNIRHSDSSNGPGQFAERSDGELVGIFHCDHVYFYPESPGTVGVQFLLWHGTHADDRTDRLTIRVESD